MTRNLYMTVICGTALGFALPAMAQNEQTGQNRDESRVTSTQNAGDPGNVLQGLEGLWTVEVQANERLWNKTPADRAGRPTNSYDATDGHRVMHGVAQFSRIMDGRVLREHAFINSAMGGSSDPTPDRGTGAARIEPSNAMESRMFISFDEGTGTYKAVAMNDEQGIMHFANGRFDAANNRVIFNCRDDRTNAVYHGNDGSTGRIDKSYTNPSYPNPDGTPSTTDRDPDDLNNPTPIDPDRDRLDDDDDRTADRPLVDRPVTDRDTTDATDRTNQPDETQPLDENLNPPYWEHRPIDENDPDAARPGTDRPGDQPVDRPGDRSGLNPNGDYVVVPSDFSNPQIVLEMLGDDMFRVTMYEGPVVDLDMSDGRTDPARLDRDNPTDRNNPARPGSAQSDQNGVTALAGNVIFRATYTRASGSDATAYRQMFDSDGR